MRFFSGKGTVKVVISLVARGSANFLGHIYSIYKNRGQNTRGKHSTYSNKNPYSTGLASTFISVWLHSPLGVASPPIDAADSSVHVQKISSHSIEKSILAGICTFFLVQKLMNSGYKPTLLHAFRDLIPPSLLAKFRCILSLNIHGDEESSRVICIRASGW